MSWGVWNRTWWNYALDATIILAACYELLLLARGGASAGLSG